MIGLAHSHPAATGVSILAHPLTDNIVAKVSNSSLDIDPPLRTSLGRLEGR